MKTWYLFSQGETFGPLPTDVVRVMLKQKRVTLVEFIWGEGRERWERIRDVPEFGDKSLPPYPPVEIPPLQEGLADGDEEAAGVEAVEEEMEEEEVAEEVVAEEEPEEEVAEEEVAEAVEAEAEPEVEEPVAVPVAARAKAAPKAKPVARAPRPKPKLKLVPTPSAPKKTKKTAAPAPRAKTPAKKPVIKPKKRKDIRAAERCPIEGSVSVEGGRAGKILDISESGCLVASAELLDPGTPVELVLKSPELDGTPWQMTGIVVRADDEGEPRMGVEFTRMNPAFKRSIAELVREKLGE